MNPGTAFSAIAAFGLTTAFSTAAITMTESVSAAGPRTANNTNTTDTVAGWDLTAGTAVANTVVVYFTAEGADSFSATFAGETMNVVQSFDGTRFVAGFAYLINPAVNSGDVVINGFHNSTGRLSRAYSVASLSNVGSLAGSDTRTGNGTLSYTTTLDGGYVLGAAVNNNWQGPAPTVSGNPDVTLFAQAFDANAAGLHAHGDVATAGAYSDSYSGTTAAVTIAFETGGSPPPADSFALTITPATAPDTGYDLEWESQLGKLYNLRTSTDLADPIAEWDLIEGDIAADPPSNTYNVDSADPRRFYAVEEFDAPPPPPLLFKDFEEDNGDFTVSTTAGSAWEWGVPDSNNGQSSPNDLVLTAGNSGTKAWATNLGTADAGFYTNPTTTFLRSPVIDLTTATSAELTFAEAVDFAITDSAEVYVISDIDVSVIAGPIHTSSTGAVLTAGWATANSGAPIALPPAALGQSVRLEWRFTGGTDDFLGWHIDDVTVTAD